MVDGVDDFAWVEDSGWVECVLDRGLDLCRDVVELGGEPLLLEQTYPVLTGDGAAQLQCLLGDAIEGVVGGCPTVRVSVVEDDGGVEVAVARVAEDADPQVELCADLLDRRNEVHDA